MTNLLTYLITVDIKNSNCEPLQTTMFQLLQWKSGLKIEIKTGLALSRGMKVSTYLRKRLALPRNYKKENLLEFLENVIKHYNETWKEQGYL